MTQRGHILGAAPALKRAKRSAGPSMEVLICNGIGFKLGFLRRCALGSQPASAPLRRNGQRLVQHLKAFPSSREESTRR